MSAPSAGKFQDHYEVLGVEHKATPVGIRAAYEKLAAEFDPANVETGDPEKFDAVTLAYEVLSDPDLRKDFNKLKGINTEGPLQFSGQPFFEALGRDSRLRSALLCVLYDRRRVKPFTPSVSMRNLEGMLIATQEELNLALWYLKKRSLVEMDDKSSMQITVEGMDFLEAEMPMPETVIPMLKPDAVADLPDLPPQRPEIVKPQGAHNEAQVRVPSQSAAGSAARIGNILFKRS